MGRKSYVSQTMFHSNLFFVQTLIAFLICINYYKRVVLLRHVISYNRFFRTIEIQSINILHRLTYTATIATFK